jgi:hypothetical protein
VRRALAAVGPAPPEVAWERYARLSLWPTWSPQIRSVTAPDEHLATGLTGTVQGWGGLQLPFVVDAVEDGARRWVWTVQLQRAALPLPDGAARATRMQLEHRVLPAAGGGSLTTLVVHGPAAPVSGYAPLAGLALRRLVR